MEVRLKLLPIMNEFSILYVFACKDTIAHGNKDLGGRCYRYHLWRYGFAVAHAVCVPRTMFMWLVSLSVIAVSPQGRSASRLHSPQDRA